MPERASVFTSPQLGVEVTPGTQVAANRKLSGLSIEPSIKFEGDAYTALGSKYVNVFIPNKEWTESKLSGKPLYDEVIYPLSSVVKSVSPTQIIPTTGLAYSWVFTSAQSAADTIKTFTVEQGDSTRAHSFGYGIVTEYGFTISRSSIEHSGTMIGQRLADGITMTASPTTLPLIPIAPTQFSVYLSDTQSGLAGASALSRPISTEWRLGDRFNPIWALNAANNSWVAHVETKPKLTAKLKMQADATGMGLVTQMRAGSTKWLRIKATGSIIEASTPYTFQIDMPCKVANISDFSDEDGQYAIEWEFEGAYDATWAKPFEITIINTTATL